MKPTGDDFQPRRDGLFEHNGEWGEVTIGTLIGHREKRSAVYEVIDIAQATHARYGFTNWIRIRDRASGEEFSLEPRPRSQGTLILTSDPSDTRCDGSNHPTDAEAIMLLVRELGAETMASHDAATGEVVCPDYLSRSHIPGYGERQISRGLIEHLRFAHGHVIADEDTDIATLTVVHGQAHDPRWPNIGKGGFPHRHVPEEDWLCP
jgi:hypothetical protein